MGSGADRALASITFAMDMIRLTSGDAAAEIAPLGAEPRAWRVGARELLWPGDAAIWPQISPLLFPVVGWTRDGARVGGRQYALGLHGFAAGQTFAADRVSADFVRLVLRDNDETRAVYPFAFQFAAEYRLSANALHMVLEVTNQGAGPMPYACGLHPGFRWPFAAAGRAGHFVRFEKPENPNVPVTVPGGLIAPRTRETPLKGRDLALNDELFAKDALCFLNTVSKTMSFVGPDGAAIECALGDFPHAALWMRPGAPFLCLEAWTGYSDPEGFTGDLFEKPGMRVLAPREMARHGAIYSLRLP
jgi:galactose mutarotase-like enzyme